MYITSLTLIGCKRLLLRNIRHFSIKPKEIVQLLLGTNGSGKSSVIEQLTPLPAEPDAFSKDGSKEIHILQHGHSYVCKSVFSPSARHSFKMDDEELNPGGTAKVQRELAKEHFKITPEIHDLIRGEEWFTAMSPSRRREWFTLMCDTDYTFAMHAYDKLRDTHNILKGGLKTSRQHLVVESAKIISSDEESRLEEEVGLLLQELSILSAERIPVEYSSEHFLTERDRALKLLADVSMRLLRNKVVAPLEYNEGPAIRDDWGQLRRVGFRSVEEVEVEIDRIKHIVTAKEAVLVTTNELYHKQRHNFEILTKAGQDGVASLTVRIENLFAERADKEKLKRLELIVNNPQAAQDAFESIEEALIEALTNLPSNQERRFGKGRLQALQADLFTIAEKRNRLDGEIQRMQARKDHADDHRDTNLMTCPKCTHSWVTGVNEEQYKVLSAQLGEWKEQFKAQTKEQEQIDVDMKEIEAYFVQYRHFATYTKNVTILQPLWDHLLMAQLVLDSPLEAVNVIRIFKRDLQVDIELAAIDVKLAETKKLKEQAEEVGDANLAEVHAEMDRLTASLGDLTAGVAKLQRALADYGEYRRQINAGMAMAEEVKRLYALVHDHQYAHVEAFRRESIIYCINQVEQALALKQESLRNMKMQKAIVNELTIQVQRLTVKEEAAKIMVKALSPTNGLIAEGLLGFIRCYVGQMNTFIKNVWTYQFQVVPTGYDSEAGEQSSELDYKFKMLVGSDENTVPDVAKGSTAQKEIVNMAFRMGAINYLGLNEMPLFFDEPGISMDMQHRVNIAAAIKHVMDNYNHSQMFLISHHIEWYGAFSNAQVCVMDKENIAIPSNMKYNDHVVLQ